VRVTLAQLMPRPREVPANVARAREVVAESSASDLVVLPELFLSGYQLEEVEPLAIDLDGPEVRALGDAARTASTALVVGVAERTPAGVANTALCIDRAGELAGAYRKTHLFGAESEAYVPGDSLSTVALDGRALGVMICFDMEFPEVPRTLAADGAELLVTISANPAPFELDHDLFARTRALENGLPHVYVNRVGEEEGVDFCGGSLALDPDAGVLAEAGREGERVLSAELGEPGRRDARTRYRELLREELYLTATTSPSRPARAPTGRSAPGSAR
jgi:predicted amidohydrolase